MGRPDEPRTARSRVDPRSPLPSKESFMFRLDLSEAQATALIAKIASHLPIGWSLGRIYVVAARGLITDTAIWGLDRDNDATWRIVEVSEGLLERTEFHAGEEPSRRLMRGS